MTRVVILFYMNLSPSPYNFHFIKKRDRRRKVRKKELNGTLIVGVVTHYLHSIDRKIKEKRAQSK